MGIKHRKATAYKAGIDEKAKKLNDASVTVEQKKVIKQDLDKLKEKQQKHAEIVEKNFDEQIKAAPKEEQEKLKKEKEAFKSKYVAKEAKPAENQGNPETENQGNPETDAKAEEEEAKAKEAADKAEAEKAIEDAIVKDKYYGFSKLTVKMFAEAKKIDITALKDEDTSGSVLKFYGDQGGEVQKNIWQKGTSKTDKCNIDICKKITESEDIATQMSYEALGINDSEHSNCFNEGDARISFNDGATLGGYWESDCTEVLMNKALAIQDSTGE
jgi:hypothetical protein